MQEEASTLRSTLRQLEKNRIEGRRELQELRRQVTSITTTRHWSSYLALCSVLS